MALGSTQPLNECQESSWGVKGGRRERLTTSPPSVSRLSTENVGASTSHKPMGLHGLLQGTSLPFYHKILRQVLALKPNRRITFGKQVGAGIS
jgi:hypothetical protein